MSLFTPLSAARSQPPWTKFLRLPLVSIPFTSPMSPAILCPVRLPCKSFLDQGFENGRDEGSGVVTCLDPVGRAAHFS